MKEEKKRVYNFKPVMVHKKTHVKLSLIKQKTGIGMSIWIAQKVDEAFKQLFPDGK